MRKRCKHHKDIKQIISVQLNIKTIKDPIINYSPAMYICKWSLYLYTRVTFPLIQLHTHSLTWIAEQQLVFYNELHCNCSFKRVSVSSRYFLDQFSKITKTMKLYRTATKINQSYPHRSMPMTIGLAKYRTATNNIRQVLVSDAYWPALMAVLFIALSTQTVLWAAGALRTLVGKWRKHWRGHALRAS